MIARIGIFHLEAIFHLFGAFRGQIFHRGQNDKRLSDFDAGNFIACVQGVIESGFQKGRRILDLIPLAD